MTTAVVFPGQGSQRPGMGSDFYRNYPAARRLFADASEACGLDLAALCFESTEELVRTERQQPAILTASLAAYFVLRESFRLEADCFAGHSLGEYAALAAAGVMAPHEAARLVRERGRLMQEAVPEGEGAMAAVSGHNLDRDLVRAIASAHGVDVANYNSPDQIVLSGRIADLEQALEKLRSDRRRAHPRVTRLRVSAPFHSRWMRPAAQRFRTVLRRSARSWNVDAAPQVIANTTGAPHAADREQIVDALTRQLSEPVMWIDCMRTILDRTTEVVEVGPARTLAGFFRSVGTRIAAVTDLASASALCASPG